jgi:hypothetical protein
MFLHVQSIQTLKMDSPCFFLNINFFTKCSPFLLKIEEAFNIDNDNSKNIWNNDFIFYNPFEHIWFKNVFDPKNYRFWKCVFNKIYSYLCD